MREVLWRSAICWLIARSTCSCSSPRCVCGRTKRRIARRRSPRSLARSFLPSLVVGKTLFMLRQQPIVLERKVRGRVRFTNNDRLFFIQLYRWCPSVLKVMMIIRQRHLCAGIAPGFVTIGAGNPAP